VAGHEAIEHHERNLHLPHLGPMARQVALVVSVLAALLAVSEVVAENRIAGVIRAETRIAQLNGRADVDEVRSAITHTPSRVSAVRAQIAPLQAGQHDDETAHARLEISIVLLQVGIVLASLSALLGVVGLLRGGIGFGVAGAVMLLAGLLA
jgi:hypothetical protein